MRQIINTFTKLLVKPQSKVRCEHDAQNWHYRNEIGKIVINRAILAGQVDLETNEVSLSDFRIMIVQKYFYFCIGCNFTFYKVIKDVLSI